MPDKQKRYGRTSCHDNSRRSKQNHYTVANVIENAS